MFSSIYSTIIMQKCSQIAKILLCVFLKRELHSGMIFEKIDVCEKFAICEDLVIFQRFAICEIFIIWQRFETCEIFLTVKS